MMQPVARSMTFTKGVYHYTASHWTTVITVKVVYFQCVINLLFDWLRETAPPVTFSAEQLIVGINLVHEKNE